MRSPFLPLILAGLALAAACESRAADVTIVSPLDYQVVQRRTPTLGTLPIGVRVAEGAGAEVRYRVSGRTAEGALDSAWHVLPLDPKSGEFRDDVPTPAGGWYRLDVRVTANRKVVSDLAVEHVGVGEVFVIAGQSNSTNYGAPKQKPASGKVSTFDGSTWRPADDPQPGTQDHSTGGSFVPAFGDALVERYHVPVAVASVGAGATSVREWLPKGEHMKQQPTTGRHVKPVGDGEWESTGELFDGLTTRIDQLGRGGFRAVLWHQGESDAGQARAGYPADRQITGQQYQDWLKRLIAKSHERAGWEFPWFVAQATYHSEQDPSDDEFRAAQKSLWDDKRVFPGPDTDALRAEYRNGVHFNAKGLAAHGKLWAEKVGAYLDAMPKKPTPHD